MSDFANHASVPDWEWETKAYEEEKLGSLAIIGALLAWQQGIDWLAWVMFAKCGLDWAASVRCWHRVMKLRRQQ